MCVPLSWAGCDTRSVFFKVEFNSFEFSFPSPRLVSIPSLKNPLCHDAMKYPHCYLISGTLENARVISSSDSYEFGFLFITRVTTQEWVFSLTPVANGWLFK